MELNRAAGFFGNCDLGSRWRRSAQRGGLPGLTWLRRVGPTANQRLGMRCHDGQKRRQRVRSNHPSGLLMARRKLDGREQLQPRYSFNESPGGTPGRNQTGGSHRYLHLLSIRFGGMGPVTGETRSHLNFESRPCAFTVLASFKGGLKKVFWDA